MLLAWHFSFWCCLLLAMPAQAFNITHIRDHDEIIAVLATPGGRSTKTIPPTVS